MTQPYSNRSIRRSALRISAQRRRVLGVALWGAAATLLPGMSYSADEKVSIQIGAASSLREVMPELLDSYLAQSNFGVTINVSFGSSGNLSRQIQQGAPIDIFMSASRAMIDRLPMASELTAKRYASGRIALVTTRGTARLAQLSDDASESWESAVQRIRRWTHANDIGIRLVIANPRHAPYGVAAEQALKSQGLFERLRPRTLTGENASQVVQILLNGGATLGIVPQSLLHANKPLRDRLWFQNIPTDHHAPVDHSMIVLSPQKAVANDIMKFFTSPISASIWQKYGFDTP